MGYKLYMGVGVPRYRLIQLFHFRINGTKIWEFSITFDIEPGSSLYRENSENGQMIPCQRKHREFETFAKTHKMLYTLNQDVNSLILNIKGIEIFATKFSIFFFFIKTEFIC